VHNKSVLLKRYTKEEMLTSGIMLCSDCHSTIHRHIDHIELARLYHTKEALLGHPEISKFVKWVAKQDKKVK
jgi:predicted HNH restriction endonuclease